MIKKLTNPGTVIAIVGMGGLLMNQLGLEVDLKWLDTTINLVCSICVLLGVMNNPNTAGVDNIFK